MSLSFVLVRVVMIFCIQLILKVRIYTSEGLQSSPRMSLTSQKAQPFRGFYSQIFIQNKLYLLQQQTHLNQLIMSYHLMNKQTYDFQFLTIKVFAFFQSLIESLKCIFVCSSDSLYALSQTKIILALLLFYFNYKTMNLKLAQALKTLQTSKTSEIPKYSAEQIQMVKQEIKRLNDQIKRLFEQSKRQGNTASLEMQAFRKARQALFFDQIYRIKRFLLIYHSFRCDRIEDQFWMYGGNLNNTEIGNLSERQKKYFADYKNLVTEYIEQVGVELTIDLQPPLHAEVEVRILQDCDQIVNPNGSVIKLQKNASLIIRRDLIQPFLKQGKAVIIKNK